jgi:tetratricopeptide (TPR) repeat protein
MRQILIIVLLFPLSTGAFAAADKSAELDLPSPVRKLYREAIGQGLDLEERTAKLLSLVRDYPENKWTDDALWLLAQIADRQNDPASAVRYRREIIELKNTIKLEPITKKLWIYKKSRVAEAIYLLECSGNRYQPAGIHARAFDPTDMVLYENLGKSYLKLGFPSLALDAYNTARKIAPKGGFLHKHYEERTAMVKKHLETIAARQNKGTKISSGKQEKRESKAAKN